MGNQNCTLTEIINFYSRHFPRQLNFLRIDKIGKIENREKSNFPSLQKLESFNFSAVKIDKIEKSQNSENPTKLKKVKNPTKSKHSINRTKSQKLKKNSTESKVDNFPSNYNFIMIRLRQKVEKSENHNKYCNLT